MDKLEYETLLEAVVYFQDQANCNELMRRLKWPGVVPHCPHCDSTRIVEVPTESKLRCKDCRKTTSYKKDTIFEDSPIPLWKWFVTVWQVVNCKNGISSYEMGRVLGVTQKTAWFMDHRVRHALGIEPREKLRGPVESDETFVGGEARNMHAAKRERKIKGRGAVGKAIVHGLMQRGGEVRASVVGSTDANTLLPAVRRNVEYGETVYTDEAAAYSELCLTHLHAAVDHARQYVDGNVHTNGLENFWALLKRALGGTYVSVAPYHLQRYVAEQVFRFNKRLGTDATRFYEAMCRVIGRRLTWRQLTAQDDAGFMGLT